MINAYIQVILYKKSKAFTSFRLKKKKESIMIMEEGKFF